MTYSPKTWVDGTDACDASNFNHIETGIANALCNDGSTAVSVTLAGANKTVAEWIATDGKAYSLIMRHTDNKLVLFNSTDAVNVAEFGPLAGELTLNGAVVPTMGTHNAETGVTLSAGTGVPSALAQNEVFFQFS